MLRKKVQSLDEIIASIDQSESCMEIAERLVTRNVKGINVAGEYGGTFSKLQSDLMQQLTEAGQIIQTSAHYQEMSTKDTAELNGYWGDFIRLARERRVIEALMAHDAAAGDPALHIFPDGVLQAALNDNTQKSNALVTRMKDSAERHMDAGPKGSDGKLSEGMAENLHQVASVIKMLAVIMIFISPPAALAMYLVGYGMEAGLDHIRADAGEPVPDNPGKKRGVLGLLGSGVDRMIAWVADQSSKDVAYSKKEVKEQKEKADNIKKDLDNTAEKVREIFHPAEKKDQLIRMSKP